MSENNRPLESCPHFAPEAHDHLEQYEADDPELYFALGHEDYQEPVDPENDPGENTGEGALYRDARLAEICEELSSPMFKHRHEKPQNAAHKLETEAVAILLGLEVDDLPDQSITAKEVSDYEKRFATESDREAVVHEFLQRKLRTIFHIALIQYSQIEPTVGATTEDIFQAVTERITTRLYEYKPGQHENLRDYIEQEFRKELSIHGPYSQAISTLIKIPADTRQTLRTMSEDAISDGDPQSNQEIKLTQSRQALDIIPIDGLLDNQYDDSYDVTKAAHRVATSSEVRVALSHLNYRERKVVEMRRGIGKTEDENSKPSTLDAVGVRFAITRERVRQIELQASRHLIEHLDKNPGKYPFIALGETHEDIEPHNAAPKPAPTIQKVYRARQRLEALDAAITQSDDEDATTKLRANRTIVNNFLAEWDPAHARIAAKKEHKLEEAPPVSSVSSDQPTPTIESPPVVCLPRDTAPPSDTPSATPRNFQVKVNVKTPIPTLQNSPSAKAQKPGELPQQPVRLRDKFKRIFGAKSNIS